MLGLKQCKDVEKESGRVQVLKEGLKENSDNIDLTNLSFKAECCHADLIVYISISVIQHCCTVQVHHAIRKHGIANGSPSWRKFGTLLKGGGQN